MMRNLTASVEHAKAKLVKERQEIERKLRDPKVSQPLPQVTPAQVPPPSDISVLNPTDPEYMTVAAFATQHPVVNIKKVNVPVRNQRFAAYVASLPGDKQQTVRAFHGTPKGDNANAIARGGPDITKAGSNVGAVFGQGFYTAEDPSTSESYAKATGALCVLTVAPGRMKNGGTSSDTAASLGGNDSIMAPRNPPWHIMFHPDAGKKNTRANQKINTFIFSDNRHSC